jgi:hypothetical protein
VTPSLLNPTFAVIVDLKVNNLPLMIIDSIGSSTDHQMTYRWRYILLRHFRPMAKQVLGGAGNIDVLVQ